MPGKTPPRAPSRPGVWAQRPRAGEEDTSPHVLWLAEWLAVMGRAPRGQDKAGRTAQARGAKRSDRD